VLFNHRSTIAWLAFALAAGAFGSAAAAPNAPFIVTASSGPAAGAHIAATVTRTIGKRAVVLPAALVPALAPGDIVDLDFPDYRKPPGTVNYHVNAAFITAAAPHHWLFEKSGPADHLFAGRPQRKRAAVPRGTIHFTYGPGNQRGIPIFFIIPEDGKTRGVDGVRDYVGAHPTDFIDMAQSTNAAVDRYSFLSDFLSSLGNGSIDPASSRQRIESVAQSFGVSPTAIDGCYALGGTPADVRNCIQQSINAVVYQTNFSAPTQAQFLGGIAGAANPATYAPYIASLLTVWKMFVHTGHHEYEYLPATIGLADSSTARRDELLMALKVPTIRPPAAFSDVLFFTIGDAQGTERAPVVVNDAPQTGMCARTNHFTVPLHFDHTSRYVHDAALTVTPDGRAPYRIALDPRALSAPVADRARFAGDGAATISLSADFGFDAVEQPAQMTVHLAFPSDTPWTVAALAHRAPIAGGSLDLVASSPSAACLSRAELQIGSSPPIALSTTPIDARRVALHASLAGVPAGAAQVRFYEDDPRAGREREIATSLTIAPPPAHVDAASAIASLGDAFVHLTGSGFNGIGRLVLGGNSYNKTPDAAATSACFIGAPLSDVQFTIGQQLTSELFTAGEARGEVFPLIVAPPRPHLASATIVAQPPGIGLSTTPITVMMQTQGTPLPRQIAVRVRQARAAGSGPCDAAIADPTAVTLPDTAVHLRDESALSVTFRPDALRDRAFGTLEMQLVDTATAIAGNWVALPATFARAPAVTQIACPAEPAAPCRLYGSGLASIDAVDDGTGTFTAPDLTCPPTDKGLACVFVPHAKHFRLRLTDAGAEERLPDALVTNASK
jgi:hypothetical protein